MGQRKAEMGWLDGCCRDVLALKAAPITSIAALQDDVMHLPRLWA